MTDDTKVLLEQLSSEYKILQDKLDKIGAFGFTVKGWSVTLVIASVFAAIANEAIPPSFLLLLLVFPWLFFWVEREQGRLGFVFGQRLFQLENDIRRLTIESIDPKTRKGIRISPRIAHHLHDARTSSRPNGKAATFFSWLMNPDRLFYLVQTVAILLAFWFLYARASDHPKTQPSITIIKNESQRSTNQLESK